MKPWRLWAGCLLLLATTGCALFSGPRPPLSEAPVELTGTAFFPQEDYQCGPAALATVLTSAGRAITPEQLTEALYIPERRGSLQVELMAAARRQDRLAVVLPPALEALVAQLEAGRPVLVLQNRASRLAPVWHYAVVVGYRPEDDRFILRSGRERRAVVSRGRFDATWERAGRWAVVVMDPTAEPTALPPRAYLKAAADLENTGAHGVALEAFASAVEAWPEEPMARLGLANNLYYQGRLDEAAAAYDALLERAPGHAVALHNLVTLLLEQGRLCDAVRTLERAGDVDSPLVDTARRAVGAAPTADCPAG